MNIDDYIASGESRVLEFKENSSAKAKIVATAIAFANTAGGRIIIGVQDKTHQAIGVPHPHDVAESLASMMHDVIEPRIIPNIEVVAYQNTNLIVIEVYPSSYRPHYEKNKGKADSTYIRIGETTRRADADLIRVIERTAIVNSYDEELCIGATIDNIDLSYAKGMFLPDRHLTLSDLATLGACKKDLDHFVPTIGGILLFSPQRLDFFPDAWIHLGIFEGIDRSSKVSNYRIKSMLPDLINDCMIVFRDMLGVGIEVKDIRHEETWPIPRLALREAIINAVVHTDYSLRGSPIKVGIFPDRVEIENSALIQWGLTLDDLKNGVSKLRNPVIGRFFNNLGVIEQWGSGIRRMITLCHEAGLPEPKFEEIGARIRVTFYRKDKRVVGKMLGEESKGMGGVSSRISNSFSFVKGVFGSLLI